MSSADLYGILQDSSEERKLYIFSFGRDVPPKVGNIDKALRALANKYLPGYTARITGHSPRKGAALEACTAGIPEAFIQAQGDGPIRLFVERTWAQHGRKIILHSLW